MISQIFPHILPWLVILIYLVPIVGTLVSMRRRAGQIWSLGDSLRALFPADRFYRKIKKWEAGYNAWKDRHPLASYINKDSLNLHAGRLEYIFGHLRDYTIGVYMMAAFVVDITLMIFGSHFDRGQRFPTLFYHGFFALLSLWTYRRHVSTGLQMTEFMRLNPHAHPAEFFEHYYRRLGPSNVPVPTRAGRTVRPTEISYRTGARPVQGFFPLLRGFYDTAIFARSAARPLEAIGREYGREVFDVMASLWGSRILQLFKVRLSVEGVEKFQSLSGKVILVFNHKSHLDFVLNFFALSTARLASGRPVRPRYIAAKDHFVDNKLVYGGLGVGKLIENVDMVFVDRKGKGKLAIEDACRRLIENEIEIAMYPQGTRALGNKTQDGERCDAGFYTTGTAKSLRHDLGHLKKGCAYLALDTAIALSANEGRSPFPTLNVHMVFIGIDGTSTLIPKGSFKVQTEGEVKISVGRVLTLTSWDVEGIEKPEAEGPQTDAQRRYLEKVDWLQGEINRGLVEALNLHEKLKGRFLEEARKNNWIPADQILLVNHTLTQSDREGRWTPFITLDRIYALPPEGQFSYLKEFSRQFLSSSDLNDLCERVTDQLFRRRGKELMTMTQQEQAVRSR